MKLSEQEYERIREEELVRLQVRKDVRRMQMPHLMVLALLWTAALTAIALMGRHAH